MMSLLNKNKSKKKSKENDLIKLLENQNKIISNLSKKVVNKKMDINKYINDEDISDDDEDFNNNYNNDEAVLKNKVKLLEKRLLKDYDKNSKDLVSNDLIDYFMLNMQNSMSILPFYKQKQNIEMDKQRQMQEYTYQLQSMNSLLNTYTYGKPLKEYLDDDNDDETNEIKQKNIEDYYTKILKNVKKSNWVDNQNINNYDPFYNQKIPKKLFNNIKKKQAKYGNAGANYYKPGNMFYNNANQMFN